ncbi:hypothetical protein [Paraburkholderia sacchari]|uniref:hypothetical protein n=1 Tax=Paraburkholderia sacchari TaxID=159450 RepID=UPI001BCD81F5|nr:hypothetical protein [Paraburkholderia sacchari]
MALRASIRRYAAHLNRQQRRAWMVARLQRSPRVQISTGYVAPCIARQFVRIPIGGVKS